MQLIMSAEILLLRHPIRHMRGICQVLFKFLVITQMQVEVNTCDGILTLPM